MPPTLSRITNAFRTSRSRSSRVTDREVTPEPAPVILDDHHRSNRCLVEADFECAVCCDLLFKPVVARCGHDFCQDCYLQCKNHGQSFCPLCRKPFSQRMPSVCLRLEQTVAALFPSQHQAREKESLPEPAVSNNFLVISLIDRFFSSIVLAGPAPAPQAPPPLAPPSEASDDSIVAEVAAEGPYPLQLLFATSARIIYATTYEFGLILRQLDILAIRYRYVVCVATGCLIERYINLFLQTKGP